MSTSAGTIEAVRWRPILSLLNDLTNTRELDRTDRIGVTKRVFLDGLLRGLRGVVVSTGEVHAAIHEQQLIGAYVEGNAMGLAASDRLCAWRAPRWNRLHEAASLRHPYELHTGHGMGLALLGASVEELQPRSVWEWFAIDGFGFQQALVNSQKYVHLQTLPPVTGYGARVFDQGIGRSLWFVFNGDIARIADAIARFAPTRQPDLWVGTGVAAAHTASATENFAGLVERADAHRKHLATGAMVATHVKSLNGTSSTFTNDACRILSGMSHEDAVALVSGAHSVSDGAVSHAHWQQYILSEL